MKKTIIFDIVFILFLGIVLVFLIESGKSEISVAYMFIPLLAAYYIGRYASILSAKRKYRKAF